MRYALWVLAAAGAGVGALLGFVLFQSARADGGGCALTPDRIGRYVDIPGGGFMQGRSAHYPEEGPMQKIYVSPFRLLSHEVTNREFAAFVAATGYLTDAERNGGSARFDAMAKRGGPMPWWSLDPHSTWRTPDGQGSDLTGRDLHPVVHVTLNDARAYAEWAGGRIPNEAEWEYAASLGLFDAEDPESGMRGPDGDPRANVWDGPFPVRNLASDGFAGLAPVGCFGAGRTGAYDMIGNVWEWTESPFGRAEPRFTIKGGSYLCSANYCRRYRAAARQGMEGDFGSAHLGFRIVKSAVPLSIE